MWPIRLSWWPFALLAALTAAWTIGWAATLADLILAASVALWMLAPHALRPDWQERAWVRMTFCVVLVLFAAVLVLKNPLFGFFTPVAYFWAFRLVGWPWQLVAVAAVAVVAGTAQSYGVDRTTLGGVALWAAVVVGNAVPLCAYAFVARQADRQSDEREQAYRRLAESLAENEALHEQLLAQARDAAVRDERQRMAREIHDTLAQGLTAIISQLRAAETAGDEWRGHVATATELAAESLREARRSVHALRPEPLSTARLSEELRGVAERWSALHGIPVEVTTTGPARRIRPEAETALLRIAQEALTNVAKHARASRVGVTLSYLDREAALDVRDDGTGFGALPGTGGFGLISMRQRVESVSGTLEIESEPGGGTGISARVPVEAEVHA
ncbi:sensor histidine kinase [Lentzea terrae]|uniref:sensor histidine kinase n=1 Tax=Lentzea terrae TaxID=2200761 RepID=UPI000DD4D60F|nr:sensor histidine kinase [Lentzea terrae]